MNCEKDIPQTVAAAVDRLICNLPLKDRCQIARMAEKDLIELRLSSLGLYIRSEFDLWSENRELMRDCCLLAGRDDLHGDSASAVIIKELWHRLRATHLLRVVK
jgi:hypothetical protein